jgi:hypothetical protein
MVCSSINEMKLSEILKNREVEDVSAGAHYPTVVPTMAGDRI